MPKVGSVETCCSFDLVAQQILQEKAPKSFYQCFEWRATGEGLGGGEGNVYLDPLALEEGIHQFKAPFHASGLAPPPCWLQSQRWEHTLCVWPASSSQ